LNEPCERLPWDSEHFGMAVAQVRGRRLDDETGRAVAAWEARNRIACTYLFADPDDRQTARTAWDHAFMLVDLRLHLRANVVDGPAPEGVRTARTGDLPALRAIATTAHTDTRFFFDERFPREAAARLYEVWLERSLAGTIADVVLTTEVDGYPAGYLTAAFDPVSSLMTIGLLAVAEPARGTGVGGRLLAALNAHARAIGADRISVATQARNVAAQRLYQASGYRTSQADAVYHRWAPERADATSAH
jgi:ribosomal protein S18 acetylase RimI-like enzyme